MGHISRSRPGARACKKKGRSFIGGSLEKPGITEGTEFRGVVLINFFLHVTMGHIGP
jgi:hypothetical protein